MKPRSPVEPPLVAVAGRPAQGVGRAHPSSGHHRAPKPKRKRTSGATEAATSRINAREARNDAAAHGVRASAQQTERVEWVDLRDADALNLDVDGQANVHDDLPQWLQSVSFDAPYDEAFSDVSSFSSGDEFSRTAPLSSTDDGSLAQPSVNVGSHANQAAGRADGAEPLGVEQPTPRPKMMKARQALEMLLDDTRADNPRPTHLHTYERAIGEVFKEKVDGKHRRPRNSDRWTFRSQRKGKEFFPLVKGAPADVGVCWSHGSVALMRPVVQSSGSAADHSVHFEPSSPIAAVEYRLVERMKNDSGISRTVDHRSGASIARCVLICSTLSAILSLDETHTVEHCPTNCDVDLSVGVVRSVGARLYYVGQATTGQSDVSPSSSVFSIPGGFQKQKQQDDNAPREPAHGGMGNLTGLSISLPSEAEAGAGNSVSWAQFLDSAGQVVGRIAPNSRGQATFHSGGADFAEWHRRASGEVLPLQTCVLPLLLAPFEAGTVVGIGPDGEIRRTTTTASMVGIISRQAAITGHYPAGPREIENWDTVAYAGRVTVKVRGAWASGWWLRPSGCNDGTAVAEPPSFKRSEGYRPIIGVIYTRGLKDTRTATCCDLASALTQAGFRPRSGTPALFGLASTGLNQNEAKPGHIDNVECTIVAPAQAKVIRRTHATCWILRRLAAVLLILLVIYAALTLLGSVGSQSVQRPVECHGRTLFEQAAQYRRGEGSSTLAGKTNSISMSFPSREFRASESAGLIMSSPCCQPDLWNQTSKEYASSSCNFWGFAAAVCALHMDTEVDDHDTDVSVLRDHGGVWVSAERLLFGSGTILQLKPFLGKDAVFNALGLQVGYSCQSVDDVLMSARWSWSTPSGDHDSPCETKQPELILPAHRTTKRQFQQVTKQDVNETSHESPPSQAGAHHGDGGTMALRSYLQRGLSAGGKIFRAQVTSPPGAISTRVEGAVLTTATLEANTSELAATANLARVVCRQVRGLSAESYFATSCRALLQSVARRTALLNVSMVTELCGSVPKWMANGQESGSCRQVATFVQQQPIQNATASNHAIAKFVSSMLATKQLPQKVPRDMDAAYQARLRNAAAPDGLGLPHHSKSHGGDPVAVWTGGAVGVEACNGTERSVAQCFPNQMTMRNFLDRARDVERRGGTKETWEPLVDLPLAEGCDLDALVVGCTMGSDELVAKTCGGSPAPAPLPVNEPPIFGAVAVIVTRSIATPNDGGMKWYLHRG